MRDLNWYTGPLFIVGLYAVLGLILHLDTEHWIEILLVTALIVALDLFPIKLPSGDTYSASIVGVLYLLYQFGLPSGVFALLVSTFVSFVQGYGSLRKINWFRFFVTFGMYFLTALIALAVIRTTQHLSDIFSVFLSVSVFEIVNSLLISGVAKSIKGTPVFFKFSEKLKELIVPILVSTIVVPYFLFASDVTRFITEVFYTGFFLLIIIYFSTKYIEQIGIRQNTSNQFIQLLETRITPELAGHGSRVGTICEIILENLDYPKNRRHDLIQMAIIHDIGKSLLSSHVFQKRGALTLSEEKEYQRHCEEGARIIRSIFPYKPYSDWILHHHEQWDGKGFPKGLKGEEIPLEARILSLCNRLDHMVKRHTDDETVYQLLKDESGTVLDPRLVEKITVDTISDVREGLSDNDNLRIETSNSDTGPLEDGRVYVGQSFFLRYTADNQLLDHNHPVPKEEIAKLAQLSRQQHKTFHESLVHEGKTLEVHFTPFESEVFIFVHDVTPTLEYQKKIDRKILESYQDVIRSLSDNKIELCLTKNELEKYLGHYVNSMQINHAADVPMSRSFLNEHIPRLEEEPKIKMKILLAVSEATTNLIKHATSGEVTIYLKDEILQVLISDKGSGIPLHELPKTILISGYSSKRSLGKGFSIMSRSANKVYVHTSAEGTNILLEFALNEKIMSLERGA